jgi:trigger factor
MNITQERTGNLTSTIKVEIVENDYVENFTKELKSHRKQASLPGFRPGKVPIGIIQKKYGTAIIAEEVNKIVSNAINEFIKNNELDIIGYPIPTTERENQINFTTQKDFVFYFDFALTPKIKLDLSENTVVDYYKIIVDDVEIDRFIMNICDGNGSFEETQEIEELDKIEISLNELDSTGSIIEGGIKHTTSIFLSYIKDEDTQKKFLGLKKGDSLVINPLQATNSADETAIMLGIEKVRAEKTKSDFLVKIDNVSRLVPAAINEDLFKKAFPADEIKDEAEFRARVAKEAAKAYNVELDKIFMQQTLDKLINDADFDLPDEFLKKWLYVSNEGKISLQQIEHNYSHYKQSMKYQLFENKLIKENPQLEVKDTDVKNEIKKYFGFYIPENDEENADERTRHLDSIVEKYMKNKEKVQKIHEQLYDQRLLELFKSTLKLNKKDVTSDELHEIIKASFSYDHSHEHEHDHDHHHSENENEH